MNILDKNTDDSALTLADNEFLEGSPIDRNSKSEMHPLFVAYEVFQRNQGSNNLLNATPEPALTESYLKD